MRLRFAPEARAEIRETRGYYLAAGPDRARAFSAEVRRALARLQRHPESGAPYEAGTRRALLDTFPYAVVYDYAGPEEGIIVVAIAHHRRQPGYWRPRLR